MNIPLSLPAPKFQMKDFGSLQLSKVREMYFAEEYGLIFVLEDGRKMSLCQHQDFNPMTQRDLVEYVYWQDINKIDDDLKERKGH